MTCYTQGYDDAMEKLGLSKELVNRAADKHLLKAFWQAVKKNPFKPTKYLDPELDKLIRKFPRTLQAATA